MAARKGLDPTGFGLAESPGVQAGLGLVMPSYGLSTGIIQGYSGYKTGSNFDMIMGGINMAASGYAIEEFLHGTQNRIGLIKGSGTTNFAEWHVNDFMIRHSRLLGIGAADVELLKIQRQSYFELLK